jgi:hypothetical protein
MNYRVLYECWNGHTAEVPGCAGCACDEITSLRAAAVAQPFRTGMSQAGDDRWWQAFCATIQPYAFADGERKWLCDAIANAAADMADSCVAEAKKRNRL